MNFAEAIEKLIYGKKIRRESWPSEYYIVSNGDRIYDMVYLEDEYKMIKNHAFSDKVFSFEDVTSTDWELYK